MGSNKLIAIEDRFFTGQRLRLYGSGVIVAYALSLGWLAFNHHQWLILPNGDMRGIDFGWMWLSGKLAASGEAAQVFDPTAFSAAQLAFYFPSLGSDNSLVFNRFYYPPTFLFFTYPLGFMPYLIACAAWVAASLVLYEAAVYAIVSRRAALIAAATPFFVMVNIEFPHTGFLTAGLMGLTAVFMERRPWISGIFLGLLTYKPHFGLLFPVALLASRNWRALGSATATTVILCVTAATAFGYDGWASFIDALGDRSGSLGPGARGEVMLYSMFGMLHRAGASPWISWSVQSGVSITVALVVWVLWAKPISYDLRAAALCVGSVIVSPYVLFYDLCILSIAVAFLVKEGLSCGFLPGERIIMLMCWAGLILPIRSVPTIICVILLALAARRVVFGGQETFRASRPILKASL